jgi:hypothetical protein
MIVLLLPPRAGWSSFVNTLFLYGTTTFFFPHEMSAKALERRKYKLRVKEVFIGRANLCFPLYLAIICRARLPPIRYKLHVAFPVVAALSSCTPRQVRYSNNWSIDP